MEIWNRSTGVRLAWRVERAETFWTRLRGWMGRQDVQEGAALVIRPCNSIHTFFMKQPIDVAFVDGDERIVGMLHRVEPGKVSRIFKGAAAVIELPAGTLAGTGTQCADELEVRGC
ncbi:MAG TPA: DUF192 domain-containing protein [Bacilli bacterium]|nr:DUF192 domain-containing protein [Bacilli bacterium]